MTTRAALVMALLAAACGGKEEPPRDTVQVAATPLPVTAGDSLGASADSSAALAPRATDPRPTPESPPAASASSAGKPAGSASARSAGRPAATSPRPQSTIDTLSGIPAVVGSSPFMQVVVRSPGSSVEITGPLAAEIGRAAGVELWVRGRRAGRGLEATEYRVRRVDGRPALDGVLVADGDRLYLRLADGTRRLIASPPDALKAEAGARVWITGGIDQPVAAFGILRPRS